MSLSEKIKVTDDVFPAHYQSALYQFCADSFFKIGWNDSYDLEKRNEQYLHSQWSHDDLYKVGFFEELKKSGYEDITEGYELDHCILNLSTPTDVHFPHTHEQDMVLLYYVNLDWRNEWYGETIFYTEDKKEILFATPYVSNRLIMFDAKIPHSIRPQSAKAPKYRFTISLFFRRMYE